MSQKKVRNLSTKLVFLFPLSFRLIDAETPKQQLRTTAFGWESYHTLDEINAWIDDLLTTYPDILSAHHVGYSYENREIRAIKLSHKVKFISKSQCN